MPEPLTEIYRRPGFLLRRAHQISVALFVEECSRYQLTPTQYGVLVTLDRYPAIDQVTLGRLLGFDRSTTGLVVRKLEERALLARSVGGDQRRRQLRLTPAGKRLVARAALESKQAQQRLLAPLSPAAREQLLASLETLIRAFDDSTRVPLSRATPRQ